MKKDYTLRFLLCVAFFIFLKIAVFAAGKGYLITKDEKFITGEVLAVNYTNSSSKLVFVNDFGDYYEIHPFLIKGFVFTEENQIFQYESKFNGKDWLFLKIEVSGNGIRMYQTNSAIYTITGVDNKVNQTESVSRQYWLEKTNELPFPVFMVGFRGQMRKALSDCPELVDKIGKKGYRYKNLKDILKEYNEWYDATRIML